jgi:hypothetical protein
MNLCPVAGTVFQPRPRLSRSLSSFPDTTAFFFLPALQCAKDCVFGHRPVWLSLEILLSASVTMGRGNLAGVARTSVFFVFG